MMEPQVNQSATSQVVIQLLEVINGVMERMGGKGNEADKGELTESTAETNDKSHEFCQWLAQGYQPDVHDVYYTEATNLTDQTGYIEVVKFDVTKGATFPVTIAGIPYSAGNWSFK